MYFNLYVFFFNAIFSGAWLKNTYFFSGALVVLYWKIHIFNKTITNLDNK